MSFILKLILMMLACDVVWWWRADARLRPLPKARVWRTALGAFMALQIGCLAWVVAGWAARTRLDELLPKPLLAGVFLWHFILLPLGVALWAADGITNGIARMRNLARARPPAGPDVPSEPATGEPGLTRRQFIGATVAAMPPVATGLATGVGLVQLSGFRIRPLELALPQLPQDLDGLTIAHVSDIHVGRFTSGSVLRKIADATNNLRADLVLMTGDLINHALADLPAGLEVMRRMDARHGVYMIEGNHDLMESRPEFEQTVKRSGVPLLVNETATVQIRGRDVQLLGLRWGAAAFGPRGPGSRGDGAIASSMAQLLSQRRPDAFPILLAHHPHAFDPAAAAGVPLTLSGHTHGGQLMLSPEMGFGPLMFRYWSGLYEKGPSKLIVSNGVGNWFPLRVNAPAEIVQVTLRCAP